MPTPDHRNLPRFKKPPVVETVLGVEFAALEKWSIPHFGLFWQLISQEMPTFRVLPPLQSASEAKDAITAGLPSIRFLTSPQVRCWFVSADDRTLIQIQNDRFVFNWRKTDRNDKYPHYDDTIRHEFERQWSRFRTFVENNDLGRIEPVQCEVSYVNQIPRGEGWKTAAELGSVFTILDRTSLFGYAPALEDVNFSFQFPMAEDRGRLRVKSEPAIRNLDGIEVQQLTVTAKGEPRDGETSSILEWLDFGRENVVREFASITSPAMHLLWERVQ